MGVKFSPMEESASTYPSSVVPMLPVVSFGMIWGGRSTESSYFFDRNVLFTSSCRAAIAIALKQLGIKSGDSVMLPAYHCGSMIEPALWLEADVIFYKVKPDLSLDFDDICKKMGCSPKAILLTHYFGFPQPMNEIKKLCLKKNVAIIEDCAHAMYGHYEGRPLGSMGDYSVTSVMKSFPCSDGGMLISRCHPIKQIELASPGLWKELLMAIGLLERAASYHRLGFFGQALKYLMTSARKLHGVFRTSPSSYTDDENINELNYFWFNPIKVVVSSGFFSRLLVKVCSKNRVVSRRRANYQYLLANLRSLPRSRPLFMELPQHVVPYVFPFILENPERDFPILKMRGVPIWRWEELADTDCIVSASYRLHLIQLPCHQELLQSELDWMISIIKEVLCCDDASN